MKTIQRLYNFLRGQEVSLSVREIARLTGLSPETVRQATIKYPWAFDVQDIRATAESKKVILKLVAAKNRDVDFETIRKISVVDEPNF